MLASGDPGFFGIVRALSALTDELDVHPAPSSVALAFARLGVPWDDALVVSAHGRDPHAAINTALRHPKVAILTQPGNTELIVDALTGRNPVVAEALGTPDERLATEPPFNDPNVVIVHEPTDGRATVWPPRTPTRWALPEDAFEHRAGMITKAEVRALALAALGPGTGDHIWDVGCGSGAVAIECARLGAAVTAIDQDPDAIALATRNAAAHGVPLATVARRRARVAARPPRARRRLRRRRRRACRDPRRGDAGAPRGGRHARPDRPHRADDRAPRRTSFDVTATTLQANRVKPLAGGHRLAAENPVTVIVGRR